MNDYVVIGIILELWKLRRHASTIEIRLIYDERPENGRNYEGLESNRELVGLCYCFGSSASNEIESSEGKTQVIEIPFTCAV